MILFFKSVVLLTRKLCLSDARVNKFLTQNKALGNARGGRQCRRKSGLITISIVNIMGV